MHARDGGGARGPDDGQDGAELSHAQRNGRGAAQEARREARVGRPVKVPAAVSAACGGAATATARATAAAAATDYTTAGATGIGSVLGCGSRRCTGCGRRCARPVARGQDRREGGARGEALEGVRKADQAGDEDPRDHHRRRVVRERGQDVGPDAAPERGVPT